MTLCLFEMHSKLTFGCSQAIGETSFSLIFFLYF